MNGSNLGERVADNARSHYRMLMRFRYKTRAPNWGVPARLVCATALGAAVWTGCASGEAGLTTPALSSSPASPPDGGAGVRIDAGAQGTLQPNSSRATDDADSVGGSASGLLGEPLDGGAVGEGTLGSSSEPSVRYVGRMDFSDPNGPLFAWSGSGVVAEFTGTEVTVRLSDPGENRFTVVIDGELLPALIAVAGASEYVLANGLSPDTQHQIEIYRRTEASFGPSQFLGFDFGPSGVLLPPPAVARRIELVGDSVSTGYGNEGTSPCGFSADTQNHWLTYGAIAARAFQAELSTVAWSGKGAVYNYDADRVDPMPTLYERTLPSDPQSIYGFEIIPDIVVINLGTNDFSTDDDPTTELFAEGYARLLGRIRSAYPEARILCTVGPLLSGSDLVAARQGIAAGVAAFEAAGGSGARVWEMEIQNGNPPGCDFHPNLATHQAMADALVPQLEQLFN